MVNFQEISFHNIIQREEVSEEPVQCLILVREGENEMPEVWSGEGDKVLIFSAENKNLVGEVVIGERGCFFGSNSKLAGFFFFSFSFFFLNHFSNHQSKVWCGTEKGTIYHIDARQRHIANTIQASSSPRFPPVVSPFKSSPQDVICIHTSRGGPVHTITSDGQVCVWEEDTS